MYDGKKAAEFHHWRRQQLAVMKGGRGNYVNCNIERRKKRKKCDSQKYLLRGVRELIGSNGRDVWKSC
jgi:hypothetical protein